MPPPSSGNRHPLSDPSEVGREIYPTNCHFQWDRKVTDDIDRFGTVQVRAYPCCHYQCDPTAVSSHAKLANSQGSGEALASSHRSGKDGRVPRAASLQNGWSCCLKPWSSQRFSATPIGRRPIATASRYGHIRFTCTSRTVSACPQGSPPTSTCPATRSETGSINTGRPSAAPPTPPRGTDQIQPRRTLDERLPASAAASTACAPTQNSPLHLRTTTVGDREPDMANRRSGHQSHDRSLEN